MTEISKNISVSSGYQFLQRQNKFSSLHWQLCFVPSTRHETRLHQRGSSKNSHNKLIQNK